MYGLTSYIHSMYFAQTVCVHTQLWFYFFPPVVALSFGKANTTTAVYFAGPVYLGLA